MAIRTTVHTYPYVCTYEGMDSAIRVTYTYMAQEYHTEISPVGPTWRYIRNHHPSISLYSSDGSHPSVEGSYTAACCFYAAIFKKDPSLITWEANLPSATAQTLRTAAKLVAYDSLSYWDHTISPAFSDYTFTIDGSKVEFANLSTDFDSLLWEFGDGNISFEQNPVHNYQSYGTFQVTLTTFLCGYEHSQTYSILIDNLTTISLSENSPDEVILSPNPVSEILSIDMNINTSISEARITDLSGKRITDLNTQELSVIDLSKLEAGVYFLIIKSDDKSWQKKFVKL